MFRWIRATFGHKPGGVHTRIATFRPKAPPPDPRAVDVEFTGREIAGPHPLWWELGDPEPPLYSFPEGTTERLMEESRALGVHIERAQYQQQAGRVSPYAGKIIYNVIDVADVERTRGAAYGTTPAINYAEIEARVFAHMAEEHDADRYDAASL